MDEEGVVDLDQEWNEWAEGILVCLCDVMFRVEIAKQKHRCLKDILKWMDKKYDRIKKEEESRLETKEQEEKQTQEIKSTLESALERARQIRKQMTRGNSENGQHENLEDDNAPQTSSNSAQDSSKEHSSSAPIRIKLPKQLTAAIGKLDEMRHLEKDRKLQPRTQFLRSLNAAFVQRQCPLSSNVLPTIPFPAQIERLEGACSTLIRYVESHLSPESDVIVHALRSTGLGSTFSAWYRMNKAHKVAAEVEDELIALNKRLPRRPRLSEAASSYRDKMLSRMVATPSNQPDTPNTCKFQFLHQTNTQLTGKLQDIVPNENLPAILQYIQFNCDELHLDQDMQTTDPFRSLDNAIEAYASSVHHCIATMACKTILPTLQHQVNQTTATTSVDAWKPLYLAFRTLHSIIFCEGKQIRSFLDQ